MAVYAGYRDCFLILVFLSVPSISVQSNIRDLRSSSSSGAGVADQTCGTEKFHCPQDEECKLRSERCIGSNICINPTTMKEDRCLETSTPKRYTVQLGHASLTSSGSSRKKRSFPQPSGILDLSIEHQFITFRGFTYEFGELYGVQVLDINDPKYKYIDNKDINSNGIDDVGSSYCTREDANLFTTMWKNAEYKLFKNNCQHFAAALADTLLCSSCNKPPSNNGRMNKRQVNGDLVEYIDTQLRNCSLVCCYDSKAQLLKLDVTFMIFIIMIGFVVFG